MQGWWFEKSASSLTVQCWVVGDWCHVVVFQPHLTILPSPGHTPQSTSKHQQSIILQSNIISSRQSQYSWPLVFSFYLIIFLILHHLLLLLDVGRIETVQAIASKWKSVKGIWYFLSNYIFSDHVDIYKYTKVACTFEFLHQ